MIRSFLPVLLINFQVIYLLKKINKFITYIFKQALSCLLIKNSINSFTYITGDITCCHSEFSDLFSSHISG